MQHPCLLPTFSLFQPFMYRSFCRCVPQAAAAVTEAEKAQAEKALATLQKTEWLCEYFDKIKELSKRLTQWSMESGHKLAQSRTYSGVTRYHLKTRGFAKTPSYSVIEDEKVQKSGECLRGLVTQSWGELR